MTLHKNGERPEQDLSPGYKISKIAVNNKRVRSEIHRCGVISSTYHLLRLVMVLLRFSRRLL